MTSETETAASVSSQESTVAGDSSSQTRQRKKRKWDQPAESLVSAGLAVPGIVPIAAMGTLGGVLVPGATPVLMNHPLAVSSSNVSKVIQAPLLQQHAAAIVSKLTQPKIQDELIAREIVINDAESSVRYKLTKRQTQEEIQRCTGAVVITRGKYRPPNAPSDGEKPLYLHISAGAHLKDMAERVLAVDCAAAMVEEMLKQGHNLPTDTHALSTCVFLGFDADPSLNITSRIRGPNDQYINHIMNETGATVILRGHGSGNTESPSVEEGQQRLHLFLSSNNPKSLEDARRLAENLLDTISVECGVSRVSSSKVYSAVPPPQQVYGAVPPPQQLLAGVLNSSNVDATTSSATGLTASTVAITPIPPISSVRTAGISTVFSQGNVSQPGGLLNCGQSQVDSSQPLFPGGTSYSGYGGIYPQATPLQQVALALRQSSSPLSATAGPATLVPSREPKLSVSSNHEKDKRTQQRRKFQELPIGSKGSAKPIQGSEFLKAVEVSADLGVRNVSTMPAPKKLVSATSNGMLPPPSITMPPPPPPPKFTSSTSTLKGHDKIDIPNKTKSNPVPDTLVKLMEYGDDDDDFEENTEEPLGRNQGPTAAAAARKPFWAL
ncbi:protein RIK isoform X1 [Morus notabilis]|uniref:protein RIK isoform X1 n=1 Tax=Morus notabilis TaxID=981085 RepID=UPI000CED2BF0|nr:protein RIK isoform X1 [Morus notabilis]